MLQYVNIITSTSWGCFTRALLPVCCSGGHVSAAVLHHTACLFTMYVGLILAVLLLCPHSLSWRHIHSQSVGLSFPNAHKSSEADGSPPSLTPREAGVSLKSH